MKLSPQELRQAIAPGPFTTFVDDFSADSREIQRLLGRSSPDPRMRDVEILVRYLAFQTHLADYRGRMKSFLDETCIQGNDSWGQNEQTFRQLSGSLDEGIRTLFRVFEDQLARKPGSRSFNRAIFDALSYYASEAEVRESMEENSELLRPAYNELFSDPGFKDAIESDTAGIPNTVIRLRKWGETLNAVCGLQLAPPHTVDGRIQFNG